MNINVIKAFIQCQPVDEVEIRSAVQTILDENQALKQALLINQRTKRDYSGKIEETLVLDAVCRCGDVVHFNRTRKLPWHMIQEVMKLILKKAES